jgi:membrane protein DedA with SNARE-associated domain
MNNATNETIEFLIRHGYTVVFAWVFFEQIGLPLPAIPVLLAAGALAGAGKLSLAVVVGLSVVAAILSDAIWYEIGRRRGGKVLNLLCRISLEPDSCVRRTEATFSKHGAKSLLVAKFIPGFNTAAPPLAGVFHMRFTRFLLFDGLGAMVWAGAFIGLGYLFSNQLESVAARAAELGGGLLAVSAAGLGGYIGWKYIQRQRFLHSLRVARITPDQLREKLDSGEQMIIVDLRHSVDFEADPYLIPGAQHLDAEEIEQHHDAIPRDRDVVLYCS